MLGTSGILAKKSLIFEVSTSRVDQDGSHSVAQKGLWDLSGTRGYLQPLITIN
jgi:hypothetical protein